MSALSTSLCTYHMLTDNISEVDIARTAIDTNATAQKHVGVAGHVSADR